MAETSFIEPVDEVREFLNRGFTFLRVDESVITAASAAMVRLMKFSRESPDVWTFLRKGEEIEGPDVGYIDVRGKAERDIKCFYHYAPDIGDLARVDGRIIPTEVWNDWADLQSAYQHINSVIWGFAGELEARYPGLFKPDLVGRLKRAAQKPTAPYCTTSLRGLWYPDVPEQTGAQDHVDKDTFTAHCGDVNGYLYGYAGEEKIFTIVSPPSGYLLFFAGAKALFESNGRIEPLVHGSESEPGTDRTALVMFAHTDVGYEARSAKQTVKDFNDLHRQ